MELEKFIEQDIQEFLDKEADREREEETPGMMREDELEAFDITRDYPGEVRKALEKEDLREAKKIFLEFTREYSKFPRQSSDRKKAYGMMLEIKNDVEEYLAGLDEEGAPDSAEQAGIKLPPKPKGEKSTYQERRAKQIEELKNQKRRKDKLVKDIRKNMDRIQKLLDKNDIVAAVVLYRYMKDAFHNIPKRFSQEKQDLYDEIITCYYQIKKKSSSIDSQEDVEFNEEDKIQRAGKVKNKDGGDTVESFRKEIARIEEKAESGDEKAAINAYKEAKKKFSNLNIGKSEKKQLMQDLVKAYKKIRGRQDSSNLENPESPVKDKPVKDGVGEVEDMLEKMKEFIQYKEARKAYKQYENIRKKFSQLQLDKEEHEELFKDVLAAYDSLKELEDEAVDRKQRPTPNESNIKKDEEETAEEKINRMKNKAYNYLRNGDADSAAIMYNDLREVFEEVPHEKADLRSRLKSEIIDLHDQIVEERKKKLNPNQEVERGSSDLWDEIDNIKRLIQEEKIDEAKNGFLSLQKDATKMEDKAERKQLFRAMDNLKTKLHLASSAEQMKNREAEA